MAPAFHSTRFSSRTMGGVDIHGGRLRISFVLVKAIRLEN